MYACIHFSHLFKPFSLKLLDAYRLIRSFIRFFVSFVRSSHGFWWINFVWRRCWCADTCFSTYLKADKILHVGTSLRWNTLRVVEKRVHRLSSSVAIAVAADAAGKNDYTKRAKYYNIGTYELAHWHTRCTWAQWHQNALVYYLMVVINSCVHS